MRQLAFVVSCVMVLAGACGGSQPPAAGGAIGPATVQPDDGKTEFQRRQEAACQQFGERLTQCAYEDAKRTMTKAEMAKEEIEAKRPEHTKTIVDKCQKQQMSSRQIRVYEVCMREERECGPLINCLEYAKPEFANQPQQPKK